MAGAIEVNAASSTCRRCGVSYGRLKGNFPVSYAALYKGSGYMSICRSCVDAIYSDYLQECGDERAAVRQTCRKLDLYWSDKLFESVTRKSSTRSMMTNYITATNSINVAGRSYDDTLKEEGTLWDWSDKLKEKIEKEEADRIAKEVEEAHVDESVVEFWGPGFTPNMYDELEQRRKYWMSKFSSDVELDIGTEALIRQICNLEIDINKDRVAGKSIDKNVNALNTLLGSAALKPAQKRDEGAGADERTPFGVWIRRWENERPIPEPDQDMKDADGIIKYIDIWFRGHMAKMLGLKNAYSKLYEQKIDSMKIDHPEYDGDEDDEDFIFNQFGGGDGDDQS